MAPELLRGGFADVRSDIFALGVVLFELLTGRDRFQRPSIFEIAEAILNPAPPTWPTGPLLIPDSLRYVVSRAMARYVKDRYQTISEMRIDLSVCLSEADSATQPPTPSPPSGGLPAIPLSAKLAARLQSSSFATASAPSSALGQMPSSSRLSKRHPVRKRGPASDTVGTRSARCPWDGRSSWPRRSRGVAIHAEHDADAPPCRGQAHAGHVCRQRARNRIVSRWSHGGVRNDGPRGRSSDGTRRGWRTSPANLER